MACWCKGDCPVIRNANHVDKGGHKNRAETALKNALIDSPHCAEAHMKMAEIYSQTNRAYFADYHLEQALKIAGPSARLVFITANLARSKTQIEESIRLYKAAIDIEECPEYYAALVSAMDAAGQAADAFVTVNLALQTWPDDLDLLRSSALVRASKKDCPAAIEILTRPGLRPLHLMDRGRYRDRIGDYDGAWGDWMDAKAQLRKSGALTFARKEFDESMAQLVKFATKKRFALIPIEKFPADKAAMPLFITGFPRSGTTMTETAITMSPEIAAGDELSMLPEAVNIMGALTRSPALYPGALMALNFGDNAEVMKILRQWYLLRARHRVELQDGPLKGRKFFTDKMPLNEIHIPLLLRLFPESPILYVRRHPLDVIVSNMSHFIDHGWGYGAALWSTARAIAVIDALVERYREIFPGKIHVVRYEDFVADPDKELAAIFAHVGLPVPPAAKDFHTNPRYSRTISQRQVREPLYDRSVGRWKHYVKHLQGVIPVLKPMMEREGYGFQSDEALPGA